MEESQAQLTYKAFIYLDPLLHLSISTQQDMSKVMAFKNMLNIS